MFISNDWHIFFVYSFGRPIGIGIYGHPSHEESFYILELNLKTENSFDDLNIGSFDENLEETEGQETLEVIFILI